jgi:catechol 2,3-dioxygenase-like lactoylglutathione lyase family enzyme
MSPHPSALPPSPSLALLANLAKGLRKAHVAGDPDACRRILTHHPKFASTDQRAVAGSEMSLRDAQLVIAREHGFENWAELKRQVQSKQDARNRAEHAAENPTMVTQTVPFFAVSDMQRSLTHYVDRLGFKMTNKWVDDGKLRWCWLEHGRAALMLQEHRTDGHNARVFEGRCGEGTEFACTTEEGGAAAGRGGEGTRPFAALAPFTDHDGYTLLADDGALSPNSVISEPLANFVPVLSVTNLEQSLRYYTEGLAYEEIDRWTEGGHLRACRLRRDEVAVVLRQESSPLAHPDRRGQGVNIFHLCEDALSFYREVTARGIRVSEPYVGNRMWVAGLTDPDGYRLSFESPTDVPEEKKLSDLETA